jgi:hypothetical protein
MPPKEHPFSRSLAEPFLCVSPFTPGFQLTISAKTPKTNFGKLRARCAACGHPITGEYVEYESGRKAAGQFRRRNYRSALFASRIAATPKVRHYPKGTEGYEILLAMPRYSPASRAASTRDINQRWGLFGIRPQNRIFQVFRGAEGDLFASFYLQAVSGSRVTAHTRGAFLHLQDA